LRRETAAVEDASIYWPLLERLSSAEFRTFTTEKEYYESVSKVLRDDFLRDPVTLGSFDLGLSLHIAAPKIEAYYQFYETSVVPSLGNYDESCENWVLLGGQQICSPDKLGELVNGKWTSKTKVLPFDHVYNPSSEREAVVLYADIQTEGFGVFHRELKGLADAGKVRYILRYRPSVSSINKDKPLFVSGYGVELMLKRTDYIVIDDRDVEAGIFLHGLSH
jgi:UDP-glucose:glycoprotein glucosyltransferase